MKRVLVLDNYDSFTWNLVDGLSAAGADCVVHRSDRISLDGVRAFQPDGIVLSPGPFGPAETGICTEVLQEFGDRVPILGVCLGMQVIATAAGATVVASGRPVHGKASRISHDGSGVLRGLTSPFCGARYHSLIVVESSVPSALEITARSSDGVIMGCRMRGKRVEGLLFHPESFLTDAGPHIFSNFLNA